MLACGDLQLYEAKAFEEDFHSWFVGQTVQRGGPRYANVIQSAHIIINIVVGHLNTCY